MKNREFDFKGYIVPFSAFTTLLVISGCAILFFYWFTRACLFWDCAPQRNFTAFDMNIPAGYFPNNKSIELRPERGMYNVTQQAYGEVEWADGKAIYEVFKFGTEKKAISWFTHMIGQEMFYPVLVDATPYQDILTHLMPNADEYEVQCGYLIKDLRCVFVARYQEFYIFFSGSIGENEMSNQNFIDLMDYIDTKMDNFLNS